MKDKYGNKVTAGSFLLSTDETHCGEINIVESHNGELYLGDCLPFACEGVPLESFDMKDGCLIDFLKLDHSYQRVGFKKAPRVFKDINLAQAGCTFAIKTDTLSLDQIAILNGVCEHSVYPYEETEENVDALDLARAGIDFLIADPLCYDNDKADEVLSQFLHEASAYLVFASGCRWNGASGYTIVDNRYETVERDYEAIINPKAASAAGKTLVCTEYSHDVPMGARTVIIGLTETEKRRLSNADFASIKKFADTHAETVLNR